MSTAKSPLVSILIPAYKAAFFEASIDSAINQTYANIEIIISDDCPTSEIHDLVQTRRDPRIRYYRNSPANGPALNYVESYKLAKGEFIKFLNDDDVLNPQCIERMLPMFLLDEVKVVTTCRREIDSDGNLLPDRPHNRPLFDDDVIINGMSLTTAMLTYKLNILGEPSCIMFRSVDVEDIKPHLLCYFGYGYEKSGIGDVGLLLNLLKKGHCAYLGRESLVSVRIFDAQWRDTPGVANWAANSWTIFKMLAVSNGLIKKHNLSLSLLYKQLGDTHFKRKSFFTTSLVRALARKYLRKWKPL